MTYSYRILDAAAAELLEAALWYEDKRTRLGDDFISSFEAELQRILENHTSFKLDTRIAGSQFSTGPRITLFTMLKKISCRSCLLSYQTKSKNLKRRIR